MTATQVHTGLATVILAGGAARRLGGGDKPLLMLGDRPMISHVIQRAGPLATPMAINANGDPARFAAFHLPVLSDMFKDSDPAQPTPGPLAGLLTAMVWAADQGADRVVTLPGDSPFLPTDLIARFHAQRHDGPRHDGPRHDGNGQNGPRKDGYSQDGHTHADPEPQRAAPSAPPPPVILRAQDRWQPVIGMWPTGLADDLRKALNAGQRKVMAWARRHDPIPLILPECDVTNVNTPDDLAAAMAKLTAEEKKPR